MLFSRTRSLFLSAFLSLTILSGSAQETSEVKPKAKLTPYAIILTGSEILGGQYQDAHLQFITSTLKPLGCECQAALFIGDEWQEMQDALDFATEHADFVITTGGLGPTDHDITRQVISKYTGISLAEQPDVIAGMKKRFNSDNIRENMRRQALVPAKGTYFPNPNGTAVGLVFDASDDVIISLPGPPREVQPLIRNEVIPFLVKRFGIHANGASLTMRFVGLGESQIAATLHEKLTLPPDLITASYFDANRVDYTLSLPDDSPDAVARLKALEAELIKHIGEYMYADDGSTLEAAILKKLAEKNAALATAEVGSGGAIAAALTSVEGAESNYQGGHVAPSNHVLVDMLQFQSDSSIPKDGAELAVFLAQKICEQSKTEWALVATEAQKEVKDNSRYVWLAFGTAKEGFESHKMTLRGAGTGMHQRFVTDSLELLRRKLLK